MRDLILFLIPVLVGAITVPIYDAVQKAIGFLNGLPVWLTRVIVAGSAFGIAKLVTAGVALTGGDLATLTQTDVGNLTAAALAYLFKLTDKTKAP